MHAAAENLHYIIKGVLEVCEECAMAKIRKKLLHKVAEECYLNPGEMIYLDIISKKKPSHEGYKNWFLIQE